MLEKPFHLTSEMITFNPILLEEINPFEMEFIKRLLTPFRKVLSSTQYIIVDYGIHTSGDDIQEHVTFRIIDTLTDVRDFFFPSIHAYLWGNDIDYFSFYDQNGHINVIDAELLI